MEEICKALRYLEMPKINIPVYRDIYFEMESSINLVLQRLNYILDYFFGIAKHHHGFV